MSIPIYRPELNPRNEAMYADFWRDGIRGNSYAGGIHITGGWNGDQGTPLQKTHIKTDDYGATFDVVNASCPWPAVHTHGHGVNSQNELFICGGNNVINLWVYTVATGWTERTVTGAAGIQIDHFSTRTVGDYCYFLGGNISPGSTPSNKFYKLNTVTGAFSLVNNLPAAMSGIRSGCLEFFKGRWIHFGGGQFLSPSPNVIITKVFESTDDFATCTEIADTALLNSFLWGDSIATPDVIIAISGSDVDNSMTANNRLVYTTDGVDWREFPIKLPGRHASMVMKHENDVYIAGGLGRNDFWKIKRLASKYKTYL